MDYNTDGTNEVVAVIDKAGGAQSVGSHGGHATEDISGEGETETLCVVHVVDALEGEAKEGPKPRSDHDIVICARDVDGEELIMCA